MSFNLIYVLVVGSFEPVTIDDRVGLWLVLGRFGLSGSGQTLTAMGALMS